MHNQEKRTEARRYYVANEIRNLTELERVMKISRKTLAKWRTEDKWDEQIEISRVEPEDILQLYMRRIYLLSKEIEEMEKNKIPVADSEYKRLKSYHQFARSIDAQFDIAGTLIKFANKYIDFIAQVEGVENKAQVIDVMNATLPKFIDFIKHG